MKHNLMFQIDVEPVRRQNEPYPFMGEIWLGERVIYRSSIQANNLADAYKVMETIFANRLEAVLDEWEID